MCAAALGRAAVMVGWPVQAGRDPQGQARFGSDRVEGLSELALCSVQGLAHRYLRLHIAHA
jgi:hypothetical protein